MDNIVCALCRHQADIRCIDNLGILVKILIIIMCYQRIWWNKLCV